MSTGPKRTAELLEQLIESKRNLADTLVDKGEDASFEEPFDTLVQKAGDYIPKSYIFVDDNGNEFAGTFVSQETVFNATENDVREGKVFASELGVKTGTKFIPSYVVSEGYTVVTENSEFAIKNLKHLYDFTRLQALICPYANSFAESVSTEKVAINTDVYAANSNESLSKITTDDTNRWIKLNITNTSGKIYLIRYFTYKEIN